MLVKLSKYQDRNVFSTGGVKTEVNGFELPEVTDIVLRCSVDAIPRLDVTMNAWDLDVELEAEVHVHLQPLEGYGLLTEQLPDGRKKITSIRVTDRVRRWWHW